MDNYFQNIFPKISGSQEDNQISNFGCPHSFFGRRGHEDTRILLPCIIYETLGLVMTIHCSTVADYSYCCGSLTFGRLFRVLSRLPQGNGFQLLGLCSHGD